MIEKPMKAVINFGVSSIIGWIYSLVASSAADLTFLSVVTSHTSAIALRTSLAYEDRTSINLNFFHIDTGAPKRHYYHMNKCQTFVRHLPCGQSQLVSVSKDVYDPSEGYVVVLGRTSEELEKNLFLTIDKMVNIPIKPDWKGFLMELFELEGVETLEKIGNVLGISLSINQDTIRREIIRGLKRKELRI